MKVFAKDVMQKDVKTVRPDLTLADLERRFVDDGLSGFPVVDANGTVLGVVSIRDVLKHVCDERKDLETSASFYDKEAHVDLSSVSNDWISAEVGKRADHLLVQDLMNSAVVSVTSDTSIHDVATLMSEKKVHRVPVIDDGRLIGIVSSTDIVRACGNDDIDISFTAPEILDF